MQARISLIALVAITAAFLAGCPAANKTAPTKSAAPVKPQTLVLLVAGDPQLGQAVAREWKGRTEEELTVRNVSLSDLATASRLPGDAVIFPSGLIGELAEGGLIVPLDPAGLEVPDFDFRDIFDQIRLREMRWGNRTLAAPLGSPQLLLAYRTDIFEKVGLELPTDWAGYQLALAKLADREALRKGTPSADQPWHATIEPLADGWAGQVLLARAAAYALHRDQVSPLFRFDSMKPLIDQPPYVRALEELVAAAKASGFDQKRHTPAQAFAELRAGRSAMALTWANAEIAAEETQNDDVKLGFTMLPGSGQAYRFATKSWEARNEEESSHVPLLAVAGRMAAVTASTSETRRAQGFVLWLAGSEVSQQVGSHSAATTLFRNAQIARSSRWTGSLPAESSRQYADALSKTLSLPRAFPSLRLPGRLDYLAALDEAVRRSLDGQPAGESLAQAATAWQQITEKIGIQAQRRSNARSLGQADL
jgi:ABC-type glycerol-3-phosphate transport system substrate-binding protein